MTRIARIWLYVLATVCVISLLLSVFWFAKPPVNQSATSASQTQYLLKDYGGRLAVYRPGEDTPIKVYEVYTHLLPETDLENLRTGIGLETEEDLDRLLEDFGR